MSDSKNFCVIADAKKRVLDLIASVPHTILVWNGCGIKEELQKAFNSSDDKIEKRITVVVNETVPENTLVCMNKFGVAIDVIELEWEGVKNGISSKE